MSAVGTPAPAHAPQSDGEASAPRHCPRCGSALGPDQEWCLACGAATTTRIAAPRGWRVPLVVGGALLALAVIAALLAIVTLARGPETVTPEATATPAAGAAPAPTVAATPSPTALSEWPTGQSGWTVVLASPRDRAKAERTARRLQARGLQVGLLDANQHPPLPAGHWVVFTGTYPTRAAAEAALVATGAADTGASVQKVNR